MRDKQFGQRTEGITREGLRNIPGVTFEQLGDDNSNGSASNLRRMVFWIGAAALLIGIYVGTRGSGQGLSQYWKTNGGTVADEIYVPIGAKDVFLDQANKTCSSRGDATGGGPVRKAADLRGLPRGREPEAAVPGHAPHAFHRGDAELLSHAGAKPRDHDPNRPASRCGAQGGHRQRPHSAPRHHRGGAERSRSRAARRGAGAQRLLMPRSTR